MVKMKWVLGPMMGVVLVSGARAQAPAGSQIHNRKENQQDRIANGVASGQLTAGETADLEKRESKLNEEIRTDRAANGGSLTKRSSRLTINRMC